MPDLLLCPLPNALSYVKASVLQRAAIEAMVHGEAVDLDSLPELRDTAAITKVRPCLAVCGRC